MEPAWLMEARRQIGVRELKGPRHTPLILKWWRDIRRGGIKDDETPWCAAFVGACLETAGLVSSRFESAASYMGWGQPLQHASLGCIVVLKRTGGGGHVGFVVGQTAHGKLLVLGGNQGDAVGIAAFSPALVMGYRWPAAVPLPARVALAQGWAEDSRSEV